MTKSILTIGIPLILLILIVLFLIGHKSVHSEVNIPASPAEVWAVLTDVEKIAEWNPVLVPIEGELIAGSTIKYRFNQDADNQYDIPATVKRIVKNQLLNQTGGLFGIITFDHQYQLEPAGAGTRLIIHEEYRGIMVPFWNPAPVEQAYERLAKALRDRVISLKNKG